MSCSRAAEDYCWLAKEILYLCGAPVLYVTNELMICIRQLHAPVDIITLALFDTAVFFIEKRFSARLLGCMFEQLS